MPFYNRTEELRILNERWQSDRAEFVVLFGRRRVGKSHLIAHFAKDLPHLVFQASAGSEVDHLLSISQEIARVTGRSSHEAQPFTSWRGVFAALEEIVVERPLLIAIDEFQFIARGNPIVGSLINFMIERQHANPNLMLILAGSDLSFFEREVMGYAAVTYGRRTASIRLEPFRWSHIKPFIPGWTVEDQIRTWAVYGGIPFYLKEIDRDVDLGTNILETILRPHALLREEPPILIGQESRIREPATYMSALRAIATGQTRSAEIAARIDKRADDVNKFLGTLIDLGLVTRLRPVTGSGRSRPSYAITDPFLRFWFRYVAQRESRLTTYDEAQTYLKKTVMPSLDQFVSRSAFEEICQSWALFQFGDSVESGYWWGNKKIRTPEGPRNQQFEADVCVVNADRKVLALGSCKWSDAEHDACELDKLETVAEILEGEGKLAGPKLQFLFFGRSEFSPRLRELASGRPDIRLVSLGELAADS